MLTPPLPSAAPAAGGSLDYDDVIERKRPRTERVSDGEREAVVERLRTHAVAGRLDADELATRAEQAYGATTVAQLAAVLGDLPAGREAARARPRRRTWLAPLLATATSAAATPVVAMFDGGFRGPLDGVAAVPFWATLAFGGLFMGRIVTTRLRAGTHTPT